MGELKLHIKQHINVQKSTGLQGFYQGNSPTNLTFVSGTLPTARQWSTFPNWRNVTDYAGDIYNLSIEFSQEYDQFGNPVKDGGIGQKRSTTGTIRFEGEAFFLIKKWLVDDISSTLNIVEVMIEDVGCGKYLNFQITQEELIYCEDSNCAFDVNIKQLDDNLACIQRTLVSDNWQGWFPVNGKPTNIQHPRFSYCNEAKPNALLIVIWYFLTIFGFALWLILTVIFAVLIPILLVIYIIALFLGGTSGSGGAIGILNLIPGVSIPPLNPNAGDILILVQKLIDAINGGILDGITNMFIESGGCGREHPAPLIRTYIQNVCAKCGIAVNDATAPLFFANSLNITTSDVNRGSGGLVFIENPHRNACYLNPVRERGVRRFKTLSLLAGFDNPDTDTFWIERNRPLLTLDGFLDEVTPLYNQEWEIRNVNNSGQQVPTLFIYRKDDYKNPGVPVLDFTPNSPDRDKLIQGICYEWNGRTLPALTRGLYFEDAADEPGREALEYYNGTPIIIHGNIDNNPNFQGELDKRKQFGATKFRLDGASNDYILDALQVNLNANFITQLFFLPIYNGLVNSLRDYADYAILMQGETCTLPKIIIWDGGSFTNAKVLKTKANGSHPTLITPKLPQINPFYNTTSTPYNVAHAPNTKVLGNQVNNPTNGLYEVSGIFVASLIREAYLVNYPMFFDTGYYDTMWDWFHWVDDPVRNIFTNQSFTLKVENCCDTLKDLGVFNDSGNITLSKKIRLDNKYQDGKITQITVSYNTENVDGQFIEIKGNL